ncbi:NADPH:quinone reductase-like Zn-dependent oxidoreductase [Pararhizobium capsulatum DSM 1112]|uniref:NADPH:quinone reductase-like Zn-dependent oxidoreductase n=1 Tax=Pararhizobium capsulatum DSM 1112 TaxID=1121113 RepID=A0ABU0BME7_9HYPH|nr:zinc-dependent alcohol dehydrogenase family protein [Pararhizobium capsulatum]MDQ0319414.1 NADPH:quinone reductase-like Zn-dependent oxidoreductase [Pararhizobium capsulatum DSM 1112]
MPENRGALISRYGEPRVVVELATLSRPAPQPGEIEIAIERAAINPSDLIPITGAYRNRTILPFIPGFEGFGRVTRVGKDVSGLAVGDRVLPLGASGLWQTYLLRPADWCFPVPDDIADNDAAMAYINPMTTLQLIETLKGHFAANGGLAGLRIAVTAAGSAIGRMLLRQLARENALPMAIVRNRQTWDGDPEPSAAASVLLASDVGDSEPLHAVIDCVGGYAGGDLLCDKLLAGGLFLQYGALSGIPVPQEAISARPDVRFSFLWLRNYVHSAGRDRLAASVEICFAGVRDGIFSSRIAATYPLSRLADALAHQEKPARNGKILIDPRC